MAGSVLVETAALAPWYAQVWLPLVGGAGFGLVNSLHCVGMCGPLLAVAHAGGGRAGVGYQLARVVAYSAVGFGAGAVGAAVRWDDAGTAAAVFSIVLAAVLLVFALGLGHRLGGVAGGRGLKRVFAALLRLPQAWRGAALGAASPFLPCGLLWAAVAVAAAAGSALGGAAAMLGFALGGVPALVLAQWNFGRLRARLGEGGLLRLARGAMVVAALVLGWRGIASLTTDGGCPGCATAAHAEGE